MDRRCIEDVFAVATAWSKAATVVLICDGSMLEGQDDKPVQEFADNFHLKLDWYVLLERNSSAILLLV